MSARRCAYVRCALPLPAGIRPNQLYCDSVCSAAQRHRRAAGKADTTPVTLSPATAAQRGPARHEAPAIRWIRAASPVLMAEAKAQYDAMLAREAAASGPGRKRGRPVHVGNARALTPRRVPA